MIQRQPTIPADPSDPIEFLVAGDLHAGSIPPERLAALFGVADESPNARFLVVPGDLTNDGLPEQYALLMRHAGRLPFPFFGVLGNHDVFTGPDSEARARFCRVMGVEAPSFRRDVGSVPFLFLSADGNVNYQRVEIERSMGLLEAVLCEGEGPVVVFCHAPLTGTVQCAPGRQCFTSDDAMFGLPSSDRVRALVRQSGRTVVWISGHTHSPLESLGLIHTERLGEATMHSINASSPFFTGSDLRHDTPILLYHFALENTSLYLWIEDVGLRESVREQTLSL